MPTIDVETATLYYEVHGTGYPVFFIHGGGGNTIAFFQQVPFFSKMFKVITVDLRGFKNSICAPEFVHPRYFAADMRAIMDAEGLSHAAFCCQSLGAWAGLRLAVQSPERVSCLFINGSPTPAYSETNWKVMERANPIFHSMSAERATGIGWNRATVRDNPNLLFLYGQIKQLNPPFDANTMMDDSVKVHPDDFAGYRVPTMLCGGAHDDFLNPDSHFHSASLIPGCETYTFNNSGHSAYFETPIEFNAVLAAFLSRHAPSAEAA